MFFAFICRVRCAYLALSVGLQAQRESIQVALHGLGRKADLVRTAGPYAATSLSGSLLRLGKVVLLERKLRNSQTGCVFNLQRNLLPILGGCRCFVSCESLIRDD